MTKTDPAGWLTRDAYTALRPPLARAAAAEAVLTGLDAADLEQAAWLRAGWEQAKAPGARPPTRAPGTARRCPAAKGRAAPGGPLRREGAGTTGAPPRWPPGPAAAPRAGS
ncbi:predicted protein [Streptomyces albidoflavus]|nr:predicted protein [Streptomyces albidoflavus]